MKKTTKPVLKLSRFTWRDHVKRKSIYREKCKLMKSIQAGIAQLVTRANIKNQWNRLSAGVNDFKSWTKLKKFNLWLLCDRDCPYVALISIPFGMTLIFHAHLEWPCHDVRPFQMQSTQQALFNLLMYCIIEWYHVLF